MGSKVIVAKIVIITAGYVKGKHNNVYPSKRYKNLIKFVLIIIL